MLGLRESLRSAFLTDAPFDSRQKNANSTRWLSASRSLSPSMLFFCAPFGSSGGGRPCPPIGRMGKDERRCAQNAGRDARHHSILLAQTYLQFAGMHWLRL